ncbi:MAG: heat-inducible transcriptional repressor HrcA [Pseudanabaena sp. ELA607]
MKFDLSPREQKVLHATVAHYIMTAEPVGSKVLTAEYGFDISAATIRHVMQMLDRSGLLYQPHTSAGRVPSNSGYRVYVDELIDPLQYGAASASAFNGNSLIGNNWHTIGGTNGALGGVVGQRTLEVLLREVAQILATISGCVAMVTAPNLQATRIRHLQLVRVEGQKVMAIAVNDAYQTASVLVELPATISATIEPEVLDAELGILNNFLNLHLRQRRWSEVNENLQWDELDREFRRYSDLLQQVLTQLMHLSVPVAFGELFISGLTELLRQPEFSNLSQLQMVMQLLENGRNDLLTIMPPLSSKPLHQSLHSVTTTNLGHNSQVSVQIGSEIPLEPIQNCTFISSPYNCDDCPVGVVGILGPMRLDYQRAIAGVQAAADYLSESISHW